MKRNIDVIDVCRQIRIKADHRWWKRINHTVAWVVIIFGLIRVFIATMCSDIFGWGRTHTLYNVYVYEKKAFANHRLSNLAWFNASKPYELCFSPHCIHKCALSAPKHHFQRNVVYVPSVCVWLHSKIATNIKCLATTKHEYKNTVLPFYHFESRLIIAATHISTHTKTIHALLPLHTMSERIPGGCFCLLLLLLFFLDEFIHTVYKTMTNHSQRK